MRLSTLACLTLVLVGISSGCAMMRNPLASKTDPKDAARRRMMAEFNARMDKGDLAGARQIFAQLEASEQAGKTDSSVIPLGQPGTPASPDDVNKLVDRLVALDPPALRQANRQKYEKFSPATLKQMLAEYERTASFGQQNLNQFVPAAANSEFMLASNSQSSQNPARSETAGTGLNGQPSAPNPRGNQSLGTQSPWPVAQENSQPQEQAPRLPDSTIPNSPVNSEGLRTVSGEVPAQSGITGSAPTTENTNPFSRIQQTNTRPEGNLPIISPGNSGFQNSIVPSSASASAAEPGNSSFLNDGAVGNSRSAVSLTNEITPLDNLASASNATEFTPGFNTETLSSSQPIGETNQPVAQFSDTSAQQPPRLDDSVPEQSGLPGVLENSVQGVQQIIPKLKDAAGRTLKNFGQGEPASNPAMLAMNDRQADIPEMIQTLKTELVTATPGRTDAERVQYIRKHVNLRMLHLVAGDVGQAVEPIPNISAADQEFWQQMIWSVSNYFDDQGMPDASVRSAETITQLRGAIAQLGQTADLKLRNTTFCHRIVSFGNYERFREDRFTTGQPVLLYCEVENFTSRRTSNDGYRTVLRSAIEIYRADNLHQVAETIPLPVDTTEDFCRARRRDYFHSYEFAIPPNLEPGQYTLLLRVVDQQSRKVATSRVNFEVE